MTTVPSHTTDILLSIWHWVKRAMPHPDGRNKTTQMGVHTEEFVETMVAFGRGITDLDQKATLENALTDLHNFANDLKAGKVEVDWEKIDMIELLDGFADTIVTSVSAPACLGMDIVEATREVNSSNWSKFVDGKPLFDENRKIIKGPNYFKARLDKFV